MHVTLPTLPFITTDAEPHVPESLKQGQGIIYALGVFDGIHLGHQAVLAQTVRVAQNTHAQVGMFSFSTHPKKRLQSNTAVSLLASHDEKVELCKQMGVSIMVMPPFTEALRQMDRTAFIKDLMVGTLGAKELVVGYDFHFGFQRMGNAEWLEAHADELGIKVHVVKPFYPIMADESVLNRQGVEVHELPPISSTWIRQCLSDGDVEHAAELLGRPYHVRGISTSGRRKGRELGVPTINMTLDTPERLLPQKGVYLGAIHAEGTWWPSVMNIGTAPTLTGPDNTRTPILEAHILGTFPYQDWVGHPMKAALFTRLRDETTFPDINALKAQLERDVNEANAWFEGNAKAMWPLELLP
jgi:riboflavin kinase / FMN adenylyltransferase